MHSLVFCLIVLIFAHNVTSAKKVYVIDLADNDHNEDRFELSELFKLLTKSKETPEKANLDRTVKSRAQLDCRNVAMTKIEKIKCLYSYYGGLVKPQPFTRHEFSQDYIDIGDLSRHTKWPNTWKDDIGKDFDLKVMRRHTKDKDRGSTSESNDSSDFSEDRSGERSEEKSSEEGRSEENTSEEDKEHVRTIKKRKPNRFEVVFNDDSSIEEVKKKKPKSFSSKEADESTSTEEVTEKPKKSRDKYAYLQGNRVYDFRRRLQHFLPKRYHWDEEDMHNLGYYWFDGPKGKYTQH